MPQASRSIQKFDEVGGRRYWGSGGVYETLQGKYNEDLDRFTPLMRPLSHPLARWIILQPCIA